MKRSKQTKRTLISSVLALVLCFVMLLGTTFAWFTDNASTSVNKVQAGTLDVALLDASGKSLEGKTLSWQKAVGHKDEAVLWEPGATYELQPITIKNNGNLALKYKIEITGIDGNAELNDAIEWTIKDSGNTTTTEGGTTVNDGDDNYEGHLTAGASNTLAISGKMKTEAGNAYQGLSIDGVAITVLATQYTYEYDSTGNQYDAGAKYAEFISTSTGLETIAESLKTAGNSANIVLSEDLQLQTGFQVAESNSLYLDFNGQTIAATTGTGSGNDTNGMQLLKGSTVVLENGTYKMSTAAIRYLIQNYSDLTIRDMTLSTEGYSVIGGEPATGTGLTVLSTNCGNVTITGNTKITAESGTLALDIMHWENDSYKEEGSHVTFDENFTGVCDGKIKVYCYNGTATRTVDDGGATLTIKGGTFRNTGLTLDEFKAYVAEGYTVTDNNGTYCVGTREGSSVNSALSTGTGSYTLTDNVTTGTNVMYGTTTVGIQMAAGTTLDGNGKTLSKGNSDGYAILTAGSTIKNVTIKDSGRAIFIDTPTKDTVLDHVVIDGAGYAINTGTEGSSTAKLTVTNSTINGWTSFANIDSASFTGCSFGSSDYYSQEVYQHYLRPYVTATFTNCSFDKGFYIDLTKLGEGCTVTLTGCKGYDGTTLTNENFANYVKIIKAVESGADVYASNGDTLDKLSFSNS